MAYIRASQGGGGSSGTRTIQYQIDSPAGNHGQTFWLKAGDTVYLTNDSIHVTQEYSVSADYIDVIIPGRYDPSTAKHEIKFKALADTVATVSWAYGALYPVTYTIDLTT